jgi:hypothetical protein
MNLRFVWHIFRKDARRLWWMIALTLALLARLAHFDSWRNVATPNSEEGWLNILLPLAWSFLIALAILEDPPVGEAPFWATVPCRWPSLLVAKAAFVAVFIHIPYFVACVFIMQARGFAPTEYLAVLFGKQVALLALTLPGIALATLVGNVTQFMIVAIALAAIAGAPSYPNYLSDLPDTHRLRVIFLLSITTVAALWIPFVQYRRIRIAVGRSVALAAILLAAVIWWLPRERFDSLLAVFSPAPAAIGQPYIRLAHPGEPHEKRQGFSVIGASAGSIRVAMPLVVSGFAPGYSAHVRQMSMQMNAPGSQSFNAAGGLYDDPNGIPNWQLLASDKEVFDRIKDSPVNVNGTAIANYYYKPEPVWTSVDKNITIAGLGKCSTEIVGDNPNVEQLKVGCESPKQLPIVRLRLLDPSTNRDWNQTLGGSGRWALDYPTSTWLSPVDRRVTYVPLTDEEHLTPAIFIWQVPREIIPALKIAITPEFPAGSGVVHYTLPGIKLSQYRVDQ